MEQYKPPASRPEFTYPTPDAGAVSAAEAERQQLVHEARTDVEAASNPEPAPRPRISPEQEIGMKRDRIHTLGETVMRIREDFRLAG